MDHGYTLTKLEEMIKIPSIVGEEKELAHYLQDELDGFGLKTELHEVQPGRPNIYAKFEGSDQERGWILMGTPTLSLWSPGGHMTRLRP